MGGPGHGMRMQQANRPVAARRGRQRRMYIQSVTCAVSAVEPGRLLPRFARGGVVGVAVRNPEGDFGHHHGAAQRETTTFLGASSSSLLLLVPLLLPDVPLLTYCPASEYVEGLFVVV